MSAVPANPSILLDLAMVLGVAAVTTVVCQRFRLPLVLGYLLAGLIIGPHVPVPLVANLHNVHTLSELGIILLMFSLGIEFSLKKLMRAGPPATLIALIKTGFLTWAGYLAGRLLGWGAVESIFAGAALGISSTMIIARVYQGMGIKGPVADLVLSALIVEDLLAILMLTLLTAVGSGAGLSLSALLLTIARLAGFLVVVLVFGRWLVPRFIRWVADMGHDETLLITAVGLCFALSLLASRMGYSVALGAFLAGMLVAESGRERKVEHLLSPLKDVFVAIFFVSIGMLIDPTQVLPNWKALLLFGFLVFFGKFVSAAFGALLGGSGLRTSLWIGGSLAQIGEFSFIIVALGQALGVVGPALFPVMVVTSAWTTMTTPLLIKHSDPLADRFERMLPSRLRYFLMHHRAAMGHLGAIPFRKAPWKSLRKPFGYLVLDGLMVTIAALIASLAHHLLRDLIKGFIPQVLAEYAVWFVVGLFAFRFMMGMRKQVRTVAGAMAKRALQSSGSTVEGMEEAVRFFLEMAISFMVVLPMIAILQPFLPTRLVSCLVGVGLCIFGIIFWRRTGAIQRRRLEGSEGLMEHTEE
ncbi:cation:proton antiporter [Holophaga foetida]|uniref:cation:proton antiporter n=1 Tax=Holophaga foetida TaxID=35839 RepID=UPI0002475312|nr:cation:proton antiporter [Holophaga foetida]